MANVASGNDGPRKSGGSIPVPRSSRGIKGYFQEVRREIKRVTWPTRAETTRLTGVVLGVCALLIAILTGLSTVFGFIVDSLTHL